MTEPATASTCRPPLRDRLLEMRADLLRQLDEAERVEPAWLMLLAGIAAGLAAVDALPVCTDPAERAVVSDDGTALRLVVYRGAEAISQVALDPTRAVRLAGELIAAASVRLR
jgi:hypothetical protein